MINYYIDLTEYLHKNIKITIIFSSTDELFSLSQLYYSVCESFDSEPINFGVYNKNYSDMSGVYYYEYDFNVFPTSNKKYIVFSIKNYDYNAPITVKLLSIYEQTINLNSSNNDSGDNSNFWKTIAGSIILGLFVICCCCLKVYRFCCPNLDR